MRPLTNEDKAKLMKIRALLDKYMPYILDNPTEINYAAECMYDWAPAAYVVGDVRKYNGIPYIIQDNIVSFCFLPGKFLFGLGDKFIS